MKVIKRISRMEAPSTEPTTATDLDKVLAELGGICNFYQLRNVLCICVAVVLSAMFQLSYVFTSRVPGYRCHLDECEGTVPEYLPKYLHQAVPFDEKGAPQHCQRYVQITNESAMIDGECNEILFDHHYTIGCRQHVFDPKERTIVQDYRLTCDENLWKVTLVGTVKSIGQMVGVALSGILSDRFGRLSNLVMSLIGSSILGSARSFAPTYGWFVALEFLDPVLGAGAYTACLLLATEQANGDRERVLINNVASASYVLGEVIVGGVAWLTGSWRPLLLWLYVPGIPVALVLWYFGSESVRWQLASGRREEAHKVLRQAAKLNGVTVDEQKLARLGSPDNTETVVGSESLWAVARSPRLIGRMLNCTFCWVACNIVYYGLTQFSTSAISYGANDNDKYLNFLFVALAELPGFAVSLVLMPKTERRYIQCGSMLIAGIGCFLFAGLPKSQTGMRMAAFLISKCAITLTFTVVYVYAAELFPTGLRHRLIGICTMLGVVGSMAAPQAPLIAQVLDPQYVFGGIVTVAGICTLALPDTRDESLPDTIAEAEMLGRPQIHL